MDHQRTSPAGNEVLVTCITGSLLCQNTVVYPAAYTLLKTTDMHTPQAGSYLLTQRSSYDCKAPCLPLLVAVSGLVTNSCIERGADTR